MAKVYVSSTFLDLQDYRRQVSSVIRRMGHEDVAMEYYVAEDLRPVDRCLSDVTAYDIYWPTKSEILPLLRERAENDPYGRSQPRGCGRGRRSWWSSYRRKSSWQGCAALKQSF